MNMSKPLLLAGVLTLSCAVTNAANAMGPYAGVSVGNAQVGLSNTDFDIDVNLDDDNDIGYKVYGGFKFLFAAVEAGYVNLGHFDDGEGSVKISGFNAYGMVSTGVGPVSIFGKLGGFIWDSDIHSAVDSYKADGFDPAVGAGASVSLGGIGLRAEYEYFDVSDVDRISMFSVGVTYAF